MKKSLQVFLCVKCLKIGPLKLQLGVYTDYLLCGQGHLCGKKFKLTISTTLNFRKFGQNMTDIEGEIN